jgi:hypothetical protein
MPLFIFNDSTGKQRADFYESQLSEDVLWQGSNWSDFELETGFNIDQLGGFKKENGVLVFDQDLKDAFDNPPLPPKTPQEKLEILTSMVAQLDEQKQANLLQGISGVYLALQAGNVNVAKLAVQNIPIGDDPELAGLRAMVLGILEN